MRKIIVALPEEAAERLTELARREFREPRAQAGLMIVEALDRAQVSVRSGQASPSARAATKP